VRRACHPRAPPRPAPRADARPPSRGHRRGRLVGVGGGARPAGPGDPPNRRGLPPRPLPLGRLPEWNELVCQIQLDFRDERSCLDPCEFSNQRFGNLAIHRQQIIAQAVCTTKLNVAFSVPSVLLCVFSTRLGSKMPSVELRASPGKYSWVVSVGPPGAWTFTWMCRVRPGYRPGTTVVSV